MRIRSAVALIGLAISFALPTFAEEQGAVDPEIRQQIEALMIKFAEAFNNHDATGIGALYTEDATEFRSWDGATGAAHSGRQAIEKMFTVDFASNYPKMVTKLVQLYAMGNSEVCAIVDTTVGSWKDRAVRIFTLRGEDTWKIRMAFVVDIPL